MACGVRCKTQFCNETMKHPVFAKQKWPRLKKLFFCKIIWLKKLESCPTAKIRAKIV